MADVLKSFLGGYDAQKQKNAADAQQKQEWGLKVATESRLLTGAAEDEWNKLEELTNSDKWDASMTGMALERAQRLDATYGPVLGGKKAVDYFTKALHIDNPRRGYSTATPLAGYRSKGQLDAAKQKATKAAQDQNLFQLQQNGYDFLNKNASRDGMPGILDPQKVMKSFLDWESQAMASGNYDIEDLMKITRQMRDDMKPIFDQALLDDPNSAQYQEELAKRSNEWSQWTKTQISVAVPENSPAEIFAEADKKNQQLNMALESAGQQLIYYGMSMPLAKIRVQQMYNKDGKWDIGERDELGNPVLLDGLPITPYMETMKKMGPEAFSLLQDAYDTRTYFNGTGQEIPIDPTLWVPTYNPETGEVALTFAGGLGEGSVYTPTIPHITLKYGSLVGGTGKSQFTPTTSGNGKADAGGTPNPALENTGRKGSAKTEKKGKEMPTALKNIIGNYTQAGKNILQAGESIVGIPGKIAQGYSDTKKNTGGSK